MVFIKDHLNRLWKAARATSIQLPFNKEALIQHILDTVAKNEMINDVHIRVMITRGIKKTPSQDPRLTLSGSNLVIIAEHKKAATSTLKEGIKLFTSTIRRGSPDYLDPKLNCHSKLHEVQALIQAIEAGGDEALMLLLNAGANPNLTERDGATALMVASYVHLTIAIAFAVAFAVAVAGGITLVLVCGAGSSAASLRRWRHCDVHSVM